MGGQVERGMSKRAGFSLKLRCAVGGTVFAPLRFVTLAASTVIAASLGYSGCLLDTRIVPDDVELRPLTPVSFVSASPRPPGSMIILDQTATSQTFDVTIASENKGPLWVHWYVDRERPCSVTLRNCGPYSQYPLPEQSANEPGNLRHLRTETIGVQDFAPGSGSSGTGHCSTVDLYISTEFKGQTELDHEPVREGDVSFARWFVVRPDHSTGHLPDISDCVREMQQ